MNSRAQFIPAVLALLFGLFMQTLQAQNANARLFHQEEYPTNRYSIKTDTFSFLNYRVELVQAKLLDNDTWDKNSAYCRIWLTVWGDSAVSDKLYFNDCEALGGCSGIFTTRNQPRKDYFILSKFGDYDGKILIINSAGKIKSYFGGHYFMSPDNNYLFSSYDSDLPGVTVFDLAKDKAIYSSDSLGSYLTDFYCLDNQYFALVSTDEKKPNQTEIMTFDLMGGRPIKSMEEDSYVMRAKALKSYNVISVAPCNCGRKRE